MTPPPSERLRALRADFATTKRTYHSEKRQEFALSAPNGVGESDQGAVTRGSIYRNVGHGRGDARRSRSRDRRLGRQRSCGPGTEGGERIGYHEFPGGEPVHGGGPAPARRGPGDVRSRLDHSPAGQDALQVGGRHRVAERGG